MMNQYLFTGYWLDADDTTRKIIELILKHFSKKKRKPRQYGGTNGAK